MENPEEMQDIELTLPYAVIGKLYCKAQKEGKTIDQLITEALREELARLEAIHGPLVEGKPTYADLAAENEQLRIRLAEAQDADRRLRGRMETLAGVLNNVRADIEHTLHPNSGFAKTR